MSRKKNQIVPNNSFTEFLLYTTPDGKVKVEIFLKDETIWLTQDRIAELFGVQRPAITKHLKNIFESGELVENSVSSILEHTARDGKNYKTKFYNLDTVISVGYRVNSKQATLFRIWATERLKEYIIKGFTMDDERLKNPTRIFGEDYFEEQLARIRDIRSSERRFYQKITDIFTPNAVRTTTRMLRRPNASLQRFRINSTGLSRSKLQLRLSTAGLTARNRIWDSPTGKMHRLARFASRMFLLLKTI